MSNASDRLRRAEIDIHQVLKHVEHGTADRLRRVRRVDLAIERYDAWSETLPPVVHEGPPRGGSSTSSETQERRDREKAAQRIALGRVRARQIPRLVEALAAELRELIEWAAEVEALVPDEATVVPGCVSCARRQRPGDPNSGYFSPAADPLPSAEKKWGKRIAASVLKFNLCTWCRSVAVANAQARGGHEVTREDFALMHAVRLKNDQSESAAGRWLQAEAERAGARKRATA